MSCDLLQLQRLCSHHPAFLPSSKLGVHAVLRQTERKHIACLRAGEVTPSHLKDLEIREISCTPMKTTWNGSEQRHVNLPKDPKRLPASQARSSCLNVLTAKKE